MSCLQMLRLLAIVSAYRALLELPMYPGMECHLVCAVLQDHTSLKAHLVPVETLIAPLEQWMLIQILVRRAYLAPEFSTTSLTSV